MYKLSFHRKITFVQEKIPVAKIIFIDHIYNLEKNNTNLGLDSSYNNGWSCFAFNFA